MTTKKIEDPVQGLIDFVTLVKPFHTKVVEVSVEHEQTEKVNTTISDSCVLDEELGFSPLDYNRTAYGDEQQRETYANPYTFNLVSPDVNNSFVGSSYDTQAIQIDDKAFTVAGNQTNYFFPGDVFEAFVFKNITPLHILTVESNTTTSITVSGDSSFIVLGQQYYVFSGTIEYETPYTVMGKTVNSPTSTTFTVSESLTTNELIGKYFGLSRERVNLNTSSNMFTISNVEYNIGTLNSWPNINDPSSFKLGNIQHTQLFVDETIIPQSPYTSVVFSSSDGNDYTGYIQLQSIPVVEMMTEGLYVVAALVDTDKTQLFKQGMQFDITSGSYTGTYTTVFSTFDGMKTTVYFAERPVIPLTDVLGNISIHRNGLDEFSPLQTATTHNNAQFYMMESLQIVLDPPLVPGSNPPVNSIPSAQTIDQDTILTFSSGNGNIISVSDIDNTTSEVTLTVTNGKLTLSGTAGLIFTVGDGINDSTMTFVGTLSQINTALSGMMFIPTPGYYGSAVLTIVSIDSMNNTDTDAISITINYVNHPPINNIPGVQTVNEDSSKIFSIANGNQIYVTDVDDATLTVTMSTLSGTMNLNGTANLSFVLGDGTNDTLMSFSGAVIDINNALDGLIYNTALNYYGSDTITITTIDSSSAFDTDIINITIIPINDPPTNTVPTIQSMYEDQTITFSVMNGNSIMVSDVDDTILTITLSVVSGTLTLSSFTGLSFTNGDGTDDTSVTFSGSIANINTALNGLMYTPSIDFNGNETLTITSVDSYSAFSTNTVTIVVNPTNDSPITSVPGVQNMNQGDSLVFSSGNGNEIQVSDIDNDVLTITISASNGNITLNGTTSLTFTVGDGTDDTDMTFSGLPSDINNALNGMTYIPTISYYGNDALVVTTVDASNVTVVDTINITISSTDLLPPLSTWYPFSTFRKFDIPFNPPSYSHSITYIPQDAVMYVPPGFESSIGFMENPVPNDYFFTQSAISQYKASTTLAFRTIFEGIQTTVSRDSGSSYYLTFGVATEDMISACSIKLNSDNTAGLAAVGVYSGYFEYYNNTLTNNILTIIGDYGGSVVNIPFDDTIGVTVEFLSSNSMKFWIGTYVIHTVTALPFDVTACYPYVQISKIPAPSSSTITVIL